LSNALFHVYSSFCAQLHPAITRVNHRLQNDAMFGLSYHSAQLVLEQRLYSTLLISFPSTEHAYSHHCAHLSFQNLVGWPNRRNRAGKGLYILLCVRRYLFEEHSAVDACDDIRHGGLLPSGAVGSRCSPSISGRDSEEQRFLRGDAHE